MLFRSEPELALQHEIYHLPLSTTLCSGAGRRVVVRNTLSRHATDHRGHDAAFHHAKSLGPTVTRDGGPVNQHGSPLHDSLRFLHVTRLGLPPHTLVQVREELGAVGCSRRVRWAVRR